MSTSFASSEDCSLANAAGPNVSDHHSSQSIHHLSQTHHGVSLVNKAMASTWLDASPTPPQIDEDDDNPLFTTTIQPLTTTDLEYRSSSGLYHFDTRCSTLATGIEIPAQGASTRSPPKHPDHVPVRVTAFWHVMTNVERLGLGIHLLRFPTLIDLLLEHERAFRKYAEDPALNKEPFLWTVAMGRVLAELAVPLRRRLPADLLQVMQGGKEGWKEVKAYPMFELMDILKRELGVRVRVSDRSAR